MLKQHSSFNSVHTSIGSYTGKCTKIIIIYIAPGDSMKILNYPEEDHSQISLILSIYVATAILWKSLIQVLQDMQPFFLYNNLLLHISPVKHTV